jgi:carbonic anhydrase
MTQPGIGRRAALRGMVWGAAAVVGGAALGRVSSGTALAQGAARPSADQALQMLVDGNARFVSGNTLGPNRGLDRRAALVAGQAPFATILSCADSRVPPELVFDSGLGDLFVHRVAGNILSPEMLGSIEYGSGVVGVPLIVVLGHEDCGAVVAAVQAVTQGATFPGHIPAVAAAIVPAVQQVVGQPGDLVENATRANIVLVAAELATSQPMLAGMVQQGAVKVVGAYYALGSGRVTFAI